MQYRALPARASQKGMFGLLLGAVLIIAGCSSKAEGSGTFGTHSSTKASAAPEPTQASTTPEVQGSLSLPSGSEQAPSSPEAQGPVGNEAKSLPSTCKTFGSPDGATLHQQHHQTESGETLTCLWSLPAAQDHPALGVTVNAQLFTSHDGVAGSLAARSLSSHLVPGGGPLSVPGADEGRARSVIGPSDARLTTVDLVARKMNVVVDIHGQNYGDGVDRAEQAAAQVAADVFKVVAFG